MSELRKYMREVSSLLDCSDKEKEYYLSVIQNSVGDDAETCSYEELVERLGTPDEWVSAQMDIKGSDTYGRKVEKLKKRNKLLIFTIVFILLAIVTLFVYFYYANEKSRGYGSEYGEPSIISIEP